MSQFIKHVFALCALMFVATSAHATLITFRVTGEVAVFSDVSGFGWSIPVGTAFIGEFSFESAIPDDFATWPNVGQYSNSIVSSTFTVGAHTSRDTGTSGRIAVTNDLDGLDEYYAHDTSVAFRQQDARFSLALTDMDQSVFTSDALPLGPPPLREFEYADWFLSGVNSEFVIYGLVESLTLSPEPSTLIILAGGVILIRRHRS